MIDDDIILELVTQRVAIMSLLKMLTKNPKRIDSFMRDCKKEAKIFLTEKNKEVVEEGQMSIFDLEKVEKDEKERY